MDPRVCLVVSNKRKETPMANKLKNMRLTSVDLVRNGANQEADICLFKSTDPEEDPVQPTTEEKNIFKRFINWLRENNAEDPQGDVDTVEKDYTTFDSLTAARENNEKLWQYTNALTESIRSIQMDQDLDKDQKYQLMAQSLDQFDEAMDKLIEDLCEAAPTKGLAKSEPEEEEDPEEDVEKFNPYHGSDGRFASAGGGGGAAGGATVTQSQQRAKNQYNLFMSVMQQSVKNPTDDREEKSLAAIKSMPVGSKIIMDYTNPDGEIDAGYRGTKPGVKYRSELEKVGVDKYGFDKWTRTFYADGKATYETPNLDESYVHKLAMNHIKGGQPASSFSFDSDGIKKSTDIDEIEEV